MLVLSRKLNESIIIAGDIRITVVGIHGKQIRIGIEAPDQVRIFREELCLSNQATLGRGMPTTAEEAAACQPGRLRASRRHSSARKPLWIRR